MKFVALILILFNNICMAAPTLQELSKILATEIQSPVRQFSTRDYGREKYLEAVSVLVPEHTAKNDLLRIRKILPEGAHAFVGTTRNLSKQGAEGVELVVFASDNHLDILRVAQTDGVNFGLTTESIVSKLESWNKEYGVDIWQAETDTIQLTLNILPADLEAFQKEVYAFCPDIVDQGSGNINDIGNYLKQGKAVYLWWD
ncbi:MAG: DUF4253 domain-containing protein [Candidatus Thiodiazotropha sp.]